VILLIVHERKYPRFGSMEMLLATITTQRSGSKLLASCFNTGPVVRALGEIFFPGDVSALSFASYLRLRHFSNTLSTSAETALNDYFDSIEPSLGAIHFDVMFNQVEIPCVGWNPYYEPTLYGYLKRRNAVVISLEREPAESYISQKYLEISGSAHHYKPSSGSGYTGELHELDLTDYAKYLSYVKTHRGSLHSAMRGYRGFVVLPYSEMVMSGRIPLRVLTAIEETARASGNSVPADKIQLSCPKIYPTGVDYRRVFRNAEVLLSAGSHPEPKALNGSGHTQTAT
jgi:hypothetical protein